MLHSPHAGLAAWHGAEVTGSTSVVGTSVRRGASLAVGDEPGTWAQSQFAIPCPQVSVRWRMARGEVMESGVVMASEEVMESGAVLECGAAVAVMAASLALELCPPSEAVEIFPTEPS